MEGVRKFYLHPTRDQPHTNDILLQITLLKLYGVVLDIELSFSDHVTHATQGALGRLRGLYRFRSLLPESAKLQIVLSLVLSVFYYCYPAYGNSISKGDIARIRLCASCYHSANSNTYHPNEKLRT
ncbi:hypothetical protein J6590_067559 [Homalodisca vitripennis]|nr:hypothetical protein J6590_067559 [Homalodisca vitripennis]